MWQSFSLLERCPFIIRLLLKTQCAPRQRNPHRSAHQRNEKKKIGMIWITYMIPHATKSGKRHQKLFLYHRCPLYPAPHSHCPARAPACPGSGICTGKSRRAFPEAMPLLTAKQTCGWERIIKFSNTSALLVTSHRDNVQIHAVEKSLDRLPRFCYTINRSY